MEDGGDWYIVAEPRYGMPLTEVLATGQRPRGFALETGLAVVQAVWFAHQHGIAHGAVDLDHVWISDRGEAQLVGWFERPTPSFDGDAVALASLLGSLLSEARPEYVAIDDWIAEVAQDPATASVGDLRHRFVQLHDALEGRVTPLNTPVASTFYDESENDGTREESPRMPHQVGRYVVVREIGRGGAGVVYEAIDPDLQRRVAVKVLLAGDFARERDQQRFLLEARAVAQLDHPNIVNILEFDRFEGRAWYAMDLIEGPNLQQVLRDRGRLPWRSAVRLAAALARALHHAHDQGLVHRDVKPNNVLLESDLEPRLTDFGLALFTNESVQARLTRTGQVLGTPAYMSPEQANGELHRIGPPTDVYGTGVVLYEALTGQVPFGGDRPLSIIAAVVDGRFATPRQIVSGIPRQVEAACLKAMQVDPLDRYPSAEAFAEDLERCLRGEPIVATPPTLFDQTRWYLRRNRAQLGILATAIGIALLIIIASTAVLGARSVQETSRAEAEAETALTSVVARIEELEGAGDFDEADQSWQTFSRQPAYRGTPALVRGWWWRAQHLAELGDEPGELAALGMAYAVAERDSDQEQALLRLAEQVRSRGRTDRLPRIVETLKDRAPRLARSPQVLALQRDALVGERRIAQAAELSPGPESVVLRALRQASRTDHVATRAVPWGGVEGTLVLWADDRTPVVVGRTGRLGTVRRLPNTPWTASTVVVPTDRRGTFWVDDGGQVGLVAMRSGRLAPLRALARGPLRAAASLPHGEGTVLALGNRLVRVSPTGSDPVDVHRPTSGAGSMVNDVVVGDLEGDGSSEIIAAVGGWDAYDVRVFAPGNEDVRLIARRKIGAVDDLVVLPGVDGGASVIASKVDADPNPEVFGVARPFGEAPGLWRLDRVDHDLRARRMTTTPCDRLATGDLDGDGDEDLVGQCGSDLGIWVQEADELLPLRIRDLTPLALVDLDADPAMELVVSDPRAGDRVWVLGTGTDRLPALVADPWVDAPPPRDATASFREAWSRAEELAFIGQLSQAADAMEQLAELHWGESLGWAATLRAATLHDAGGRPVHAGTLALRAASALDGLSRVAALRAAARAWQDAREPARELDVLEQLRDLGALDRVDVVRLRFLENAAARQRFVVDLRDPLEAGWHIDQPLALRHAASDGLLLEAFGNQTLAHVPLEWDGGPLSLDLEFELEGVEWDGGLQVGLVAAGTEAPLYGIEVRGNAGAHAVQPVVQCRAGGETLATSFEAGRPVTARFQLRPNGFSCTYAGEDGFRADHDGELSVMGFGRWDLVIRAIGAPDTVAKAVLRRIEVEGARVDPEAPPSPAARRAFVNGRIAEADALLTSDREDPRLSVAIAAARNDGEALRAKLTAMRDAPREPLLTHLLHCRLDALGGDLQRLLRDDFPWWFAQAWRTALSRPRPDAALGDALRQALDGLEDDEPTAQDRDAWIRLAAKRGAAALDVGDLDLAEASFDAALRWFDALREDDEVAAEALRIPIARLHLDRASLAVRRDAPVAQSLDALREALSWAPDPRLLLDRARVRPELADLQGSALVQQWHRGLRADQGVSFGSGG